MLQKKVFHITKPVDKGSYYHFGYNFLSISKDVLKMAFLDAKLLLVLNFDFFS